MEAKQSAQVIDLKTRKGHLIKKPFVPQSGNLENGDYLDWLRYLQDKGDTFSFKGENI